MAQQAKSIAQSNFIIKCKGLPRDNKNEKAVKDKKKKEKVERHYDNKKRERRESGEPKGLQTRTNRDSREQRGAENKGEWGGRGREAEV